METGKCSSVIIPLEQGKQKDFKNKRIKDQYSTKIWSHLKNESWKKNKKQIKMSPKGEKYHWMKYARDFLL